MIIQTKDMNGPARAAYMRSERIPLPMTTEEPFDHMQNNYCFITGKRIVDGDDCRFTFEWDAWVSTAGQNLIEEWVANGMKEPNVEYETIYREWYAQDAAAAAEDANENNEEFRRWHK